MTNDRTDPSMCCSTQGLVRSSQALSGTNENFRLRVLTVHFKTWYHLLSFHFRVRYDLRSCLLAWNTCLAVFSMVGLMRTLPELRDSIRNNGFYGSVCIKGNGSHQIAGKFGVELIFRPDINSYLFTMGDLA